MSYNSYKSYRGRGGGGFGSRGGYRGSSRGEGGWSSGGSRGRGSSSRGGSGRFNSWDKDGSGGYVDSRGRYSGGSDYGSSERYTSSRGGRDDSSYGRRYSRQGSPGRYENHRSSPEPPRKRIRSESGGGYQGSSSIRRVHDDSYGSSGGAGGGNEYSGRSYSGGYGGSEEKGGAGSYGGSGERSRSYREERSRGDDYSYRKIMGPPSGPPRRSSPRGSYRGRSFRGSRSSMSFRGSRGFKRGEFSLVKKRLIDVSYSIKKKDYLRKLKMIKLKRLAERYRREKERSSLDKDEKKRLDKLNGEDEIDDEEEIEVEEEVETSVEEEEEEEEGEDREDEDGEVDEEKELEENGEKKDDEEELEEGETNDDDTAIKKKPKKKIVRKKVKKIVKKKIKKEKPAAAKTKSKDKSDCDETKEGVHVTIKQDSETRAVNEEGRKNYLGRPFIRLECHHCNIRCVTFKEYNLHLHTAKHVVSMRRLSLKLRQQLARMRIEQRREQLILDQEHKDNPALRTFFCSTCKLNHRSLKGQHLASARHRKMKEFLMPYCRICRVTFRSPMGYENHLCELSHIRQTAKLEYLLTKRKEKEEAGRNVDMDNFMILDSVGSPDESEEESGKEEGETEKNGVAASAGEVGDEGEGGVKEKKDVKKKKKKTEIKLGLEYCKKVEVIYCELCNIYLTRHLPQDKVVAQHCRTRIHLERLVRANKYKRRSSRHTHSKTKDDDKEKTGKEGEAGEKDGKESADKSGGGSELDTSTATTSPTKKKGDATSELEDGDIDEKLWSEVDKDLGDLLREVEPDAKSSDEDEEREKSRYDRFKLSEKDKTSLKKEVTDDDDDAKVNSVGIKPTVKKSDNKKKIKVEEVEDEEEEEDDDDKEAKET